MLCDLSGTSLSFSSSFICFSYHQSSSRAYAQTGLPGFDFAVVTYKSKNISGYNYTIGEYVGHAGLAEVSGFDDPMLDNSTITGYPGDRTGGRSMWTMGQCESGIFNASEYWLKTYGTTEPEWDPIRVGFYDCDITGGKLFIA